MKKESGKYRWGRIIISISVLIILMIGYIAANNIVEFEVNINNRDLKNHDL